MLAIHQTNRFNSDQKSGTNINVKLKRGHQNRLYSEIQVSNQKLKKREKEGVIK